jgi:hypothetical protein
MAVKTLRDWPVPVLNEERNYTDHSASRSRQRKVFGDRHMLFLDYAATLAVAASVRIPSAMPSALDHLLARTRELDAESRESCWTQPLIE